MITVVVYSTSTQWLS